MDVFLFFLFMEKRHITDSVGKKHFENHIPLIEWKTNKQTYTAIICVKQIDGYKTE